MKTPTKKIEPLELTDIIEYSSDFLLAKQVGLLMNKIQQLIAAHNESIPSIPSEPTTLHNAVLSSLDISERALKEKSEAFWTEQFRLSEEKLAAIRETND